jgi:type II secretory pathway pseudopilin PulG
MLDAMQRRSWKTGAFTLIELLVVISIIIVLMGLLFPAFRGAQDQAKKVQAKNDLTQIVTAVNAFYTEYGRYPTDSTADITYGATGSANDALFKELRSAGGPVNTRQIVFLNAPDAKDPANPRSGIGTTTGSGQYFDPWGTPYNISLDADYSNTITNPYGSAGGAGADPLRQGVLAWSFGKDKASGNKGDHVYKSHAGSQSDDVISWQ